MPVRSRLAPTLANTIETVVSGDIDGAAITLAGEHFLKLRERANGHEVRTWLLDARDVTGIELSLVFAIGSQVSALADTGLKHVAIVCPAEARDQLEMFVSTLMSKLAVRLFTARTNATGWISSGCR